MRTVGRCALALIATAFATSAVRAATFADLSGGPDPQAYGAAPLAAGPYAANPYGCPCPPGPTPARAYAGAPAYAPFGYGLPANYGGYTALSNSGAAGPYAGARRAYAAEARPAGAPFSGGPEGAPPDALDAPGMTAPPIPPTAFLPYGPAARLPNVPLQAASFQQVNSTTDPYNAWGLSTPFMFVPWSTPLSGWTNAQTWNWWRERSGASSYGW